MFKKSLLIALVITVLATSFVFADGSQSVLSKVTGLPDSEITALSQNRMSFGRILTASIVAKLTNTKIQDVLTQNQSGTSFYQIAQDKGIKLEQYQKAMLDGKLAYIDEQVKAGILTADQAKLIKERMTQQITNCNGLGNSVDKFGPGMGGCGKGMSGKGFGQFNGSRQINRVFNQ